MVQYLGAVMKSTFHLPRVRVKLLFQTDDGAYQEGQAVNVFHRRTKVHVVV
jgi:hypothetical protein